MMEEARETGEAPDDETLAERARHGDVEAFGMLMERYRGKAVHWARGWSRDPDLAEDIAQDALIKAFLHAGQLVHPSRFMEWLRTIVRNSAYARLRRGGPYGREKPMSSMLAGMRGRDGAGAEAETLERLLERIGRRAADGDEAEPMRQLVRRESARLIRSLLDCLNERERGMVEKFFFEQLRPEEISALYGTTTGSVYAHLHRSRKKLRAYADASGLQPELRAAGSTDERSRSLAMLTGRPDAPYTLIERLCRLIRSKGGDGNAARWMGESGMAFRVRVSRLNTYADGVHVFDWQGEIRRLLGAFGYEPEFLAGRARNAPAPLVAVAERFRLTDGDAGEVARFVREAVDCGSPVLFFDTHVGKPYVHEWNLIYAYNDFNRTVTATDLASPYQRTLTYGELAASPLLFLCRARVKDRPDPGRSAEDALAAVVRQAREGDGYRHGTPYLRYATGLGAYDVWAEQLEGGLLRANEYGHRYMAHVYARARAFAGPYLRSLAAPEGAAELIAEAAGDYDTSARLLGEAAALLPWDSDGGGEPWSAETLRRSAGLIRRAKAHEERAVERLERALRIMGGGKS
jgi:RNA polymerase sigma factor (sigma-70 family)